MRFVIVTGMSGAGKSHALNCLEDLGYYCMDNLPPQMFGAIHALLSEVKTIDRAAIGVDVRGGDFFPRIMEELQKFDAAHVEYEILYLDCSDEVLIRRYKETRRIHPLSQGSLSEAIRRERQLLTCMRTEAHVVIDTTHMNVHMSKARIQELYAGSQEQGFPVHVMSFGFKNGVPQEADLVFDVRFLDNPFYIEALKPLTGMDEAVYRYVMDKPATQEFMQHLTGMLGFLLPRYIHEGKGSLVVAFGCTGGQHRSVSLARACTEWLRGEGYRVRCEHRDMKGANA